jgi:hypothetical protein
MYITDPRKRRARKVHRCVWCGEIIQAGETYWTWKACDAGTWIAAKMHRECHQATARWCSENDAEWLPDEGSMRRGCICEPGDPCTCGAEGVSP